MWWMEFTMKLEVRQKNYNQNYRMGGRYLVWRLDDSSAVTQPTVSTQPTKTKEQVAVAASVSGDPYTLQELIEMAQHLSGLAQVSESEIGSLVSRIESARSQFELRKNSYVAPNTVLAEIDMALQHATNAVQFAKNSSTSDAKVRLGWAAARLKRANERLVPVVK